MKCLAPWVTVRQDEDGSIVPCSSYFTRFKNVKIGTTHKNIQEFFNSTEYNEFRMRMCNDENIEGCIECKVDTENGNPSHRDYWNNKYSHITEPAIRELDICLSNKCNFQCIMCNSYFSNKWYEDDKALEELGVDKKHQLAPQRHITSPDDMTGVKLDNLELLRIIGGEPLMEPRFLNIFKVLKERQIIQNVELFINTNNSIFPNQEWQDYLKLFKKISLVISIDSVGKLGEWNRRGLDMKKMDMHEGRWQNFTENISYNSVIHNFSVLGLNDLINWVDLPIHYGTEGKDHALDLTLGPPYLCIQNLPEHTKELIADKLNQRLHKVKDFMFAEKHNPRYVKQYKKFYNYFEKKWGMPKENKLIYESVCEKY
jgi:hypothetical protein